EISLLPSNRLGDSRLRGTTLSGSTPAARSLARLRIAEHITAPAQGSLLACRAQLWPGGTLTRWTTLKISGVPLSSFPLDQQSLVAPRPSSSSGKHSRHYSRGR